MKFVLTIQQAPDKTANMVKIEFKWMGILKKKSSMFVGTRPEFEIALYTLLYFIGDEGTPNNAMFGDHEVDIHIVRGIKGKQPGLLTVYPEEVEVQWRSQPKKSGRVQNIFCCW